jgi:hypothetical protein
MAVRLLAALAAAAMVCGCQAQSATSQQGTEERPRLGLMTTLPIYWGEHEDFANLLAPAADAGWVRRTLEADYRLEPLDTLAAQTLVGRKLLILAQPRALSPRENVALDSWVRAGGRVLIFADPLLTAHSRFPIGDSRRPQAVALLSPILAHWGLELVDPGNGEATTSVELDGQTLPVAAPGQLRPTARSGCTVLLDGLLARCALGRGQATILADAAVLDEDGAQAANAAALKAVLDRAFD